jgi:hypothetical protein
VFIIRCALVCAESPRKKARRQSPSVKVIIAQPQMFFREKSAASSDARKWHVILEEF